MTKNRILPLAGILAIFTAALFIVALHAQLAPGTSDSTLTAGSVGWQEVSGTSSGGLPVVLTGTNLAGTLPAANAGAFFDSIASGPALTGSTTAYSGTGTYVNGNNGYILANSNAPTSGTSAVLYFKVAGTGATGWTCLTSTNGATIVQ